MNGRTHEGRPHLVPRRSGGRYGVGHVGGRVGGYRLGSALMMDPRMTIVWAGTWLALGVYLLH